MKIIPALRASLALALLAACASLSARADQVFTESVKLSSAGKPGTLRVDMPWADIKVTAIDGDTVSVKSTLNTKSSKVDRPGGLRRLDDQVSFELTEKDNVVVLALVGEGARGARDAEFNISVPRSMNLDIKTSVGGEVAVKDVEGDITVEGLNGEVRLDGISGAAVVNTMNGEVTANYVKTPTKPINIVSMNGEVVLRVPADTKANVSLRTHNGSILTDFDETALKTKTEGRSTNSYTYSYGDTEAARRAAQEATQAAKAAVRDAMQIAKEVADEVQRSLSEDDAAHAEAPTAPTPPKPATKPRATRAPRAPMAPITGGKLVSGALNGGGVDIKISTMNGEITLRQAK